MTPHSGISLITRQRSLAPASVWLRRPCSVQTTELGSSRQWRRNFAIGCRFRRLVLSVRALDLTPMQPVLIGRHQSWQPSRFIMTKPDFRPTGACDVTWL